ncbi:MAG: methylated-DNA--[protein]-cysteine S-methyltransferase [Alphaproteobacteria bacterium]|nr:methylated-DNA--[protein]-cysteine S-methyltransferase [Alphaproteobacteria bacterium]OJV14096.1 MAG: hypothetical protein BGO27_01245 [Alphaproteobacteria bacterium 33-17]
MYKKIIDSPVGKILAISNGKEITAIYTENHKYFIEINDNHTLEVFDLLEAELNSYFKGELNNFTVPLIMQGTEFQKKIWKKLCEISHGKVLSYLDIAKKIGNIKAVRAVANAIAKNPISIIVPCHRVIGSNGKLTGYAGGINAKEYLLELESRITCI